MTIVNGKNGSKCINKQNGFFGFDFDRKRESQKVRKTERQKDRKTERQKDRKTERQKDRKTERQTDTKTEKHKDRKSAVKSKANIYIQK
jgi:hypothetical protein